MWFTLSFKNDARVINYAVDKHKELVDRFSSLFEDRQGFQTFAMFQPITQSIVRRGVENGGNVMGLDEYVADDGSGSGSGSGSGVMFSTAVALHGARQEAVAIPMMEAYTGAVDEYARSIGAAWDWQYLNYANKLQDPIATFGGAALAKIRAASATYDPDGVFQKLRLSGFKIPPS